VSGQVGTQQRMHRRRVQLHPSQKGNICLRYRCVPTEPPHCNAAEKHAGPKAASHTNRCSKEKSGVEREHRTLAGLLRSWSYTLTARPDAAAACSAGGHPIRALHSPWRPLPIKRAARCPEPFLHVLAVGVDCIPANRAPCRGRAQSTSISCVTSQCCSSCGVMKNPTPCSHLREPDPQHHEEPQPTPPPRPTRALSLLKEGGTLGAKAGPARPRTASAGGLVHQQTVEALLASEASWRACLHATRGVQIAPRRTTRKPIDSHELPAAALHCCLKIDPKSAGPLLPLRSSRRTKPTLQIPAAGMTACCLAA
jgi:hypothetical protein